MVIHHGLHRARLSAVLLCAMLAYPAADAIAATASKFAVTYLVSDGATPAKHIDPNLKNAWGLAFDGLGPVYPLGPGWVADNGTSVATLYDGRGVAQPPGLPFVIKLPAGSNGDASPTGIVFNDSLFEFPVKAPGLPALPSMFIFAGEGGTLSAWTITNLLNAVTVYDDGAGGAVYKGLAKAKSKSGANQLYATDFHNNKIDVFNQHFAKLPAAGFTDPQLPPGYAPFGIQAVDNTLYVSYALQRGPDNHDEIDGPGFGLVDQFDADGNFIKRLATGDRLNAPWGIAKAPATFGSFSNALLIGNFGDGLINAYDPASGSYLGTLSDANGYPIYISGLWGIAFGNGFIGESQPTNTLFFAAGTNDEVDGAYGRIDLIAK